MGVVFVQVGQCGNQVGQEFWSQALESLQRPSKSAQPLAEGFFDEGDGKGPKARCVLVDSEPKVVRTASGLCSRGRQPSKTAYQPRDRMVPPGSLFRQSNVIYEQSGRGNNWAMGYFGREQSEGAEGSLAGRALEAVRKEAERCDFFAGCVLSHSLGGGTGSGLGCRVLEALRDDYPRRYLLSLAVRPFSTGDSPLQHYNSLLAASHLQRFSDAVLLVSNDAVLGALGGHINGGGQQRKGTEDVVDMKNINAYIGGTLLETLAPSAFSSYAGRYRNNAGLVSEPLGLEKPALGLETFQPFDLVNAVCPMPITKFAEIWTTAGLPLTTQHHYTPRMATSSARTSVRAPWDELVEVLCRTMPRFEPGASSQGVGALVDDRRITTLAVQVLARGDDDGQLGDARFFKSKVAAKLEQHMPAPSWNPFPYDYKVSAAQGVAAPRSLTAVANRSSTGTYLSQTLGKARRMLDAGAYCHWYERYGCDRDMLEESFDNVHCIVDDYRAMCAR